MKKIKNLQQLNWTKGELFIKVVCPNCKNVLVSLVPNAEKILQEEKCAICEDYEENIFSIIEFKPLSEKQIIEKLSRITKLSEAEVVS